MSTLDGGQLHALAASPPGEGLAKTFGRRLGVPQSLSGRFGGDKFSWSSQERNHFSSGQPIRRPVTVATDSVPVRSELCVV
jgi:hypothetical protein